MNTEMDKYWELILANEKLIWTIIHQRTKYNKMDIYQESLILIYKEICGLGCDIDTTLLQNIFQYRVIDAVRSYAKYSRDLPFDPNTLCEIGAKNKKSRAKNDIKDEGGDEYAA